MMRTAHNICSTISINQTSGPTSGVYTIRRRARFWAVFDPAGALVCITVYKCGAEEVIRRLVGGLSS